MAGAVCFDLGGTLIDRERAEGLRAHWVARGVRIGIRDAEAVIYRMDRVFMESYPNLWHEGGGEFQRRYWGRVHAELGLVAPGLAVCAGWGGGWRVYGDALVGLRQLRRAGCRLALLSNWDHSGTAVLAATGLTDFFEVVGISAALGREKPDPEAFAWVADALDLPAESITHVGDNVWDDVQGARTAGMKPVLVHRHPEWHAPPPLPPDVTVVDDLAACVPYLLRRTAREAVAL